MSQHNTNDLHQQLTDQLRDMLASLDQPGVDVRAVGRQLGRLVAEQVALLTSASVSRPDFAAGVAEGFQGIAASVAGKTAAGAMTFPEQAPRLIPIDQVRRHVEGLGRRGA